MFVKRRRNYFIPFVISLGLFVLASIALAKTSNDLEDERGKPPKVEYVEVEVEVTPAPTPEVTTPPDEPMHTLSPEEVANLPEYSKYTETDVNLLAKIMTAESGPYWPDWAIMTIGEVVLNRVESQEFPNDLYSVIYQSNPVQYAPVYSGQWSSVAPTEEVKELARRLLYGERPVGDPAMVFQALFEQGSATVVSYYDSYLGTTTYFCDANNMSLY